MKKKLDSLGLTTEAKRMMVQCDSQDIPVLRQCELLTTPLRNFSCNFEIDQLINS